MRLSILCRTIAAPVAIVVTTTACAPSLPYVLGNGFYSENYSKTQVQAAANNGKVKFLGKFTEDGTACGNFTQDITDTNLILPVVKTQMGRLGGNATDNIVTKWNFTDFMLAITLAPLLAGCRSYTISGEVMLVMP